MEDLNVFRVMEMLKKRSEIGVKKYKTTTMRSDLDVLAWVQHLQEELCDAAVYCEALKEKLKDEIHSKTDWK